MARAQFLYEGRKLRYGSVEEQVAIWAFNRHREIEFLKPVFSVVDPKKIGGLINKYRGILYPEFVYDDFKYIKKANKVFEKMRNINFDIKRAG